MPFRCAPIWVAVVSSLRGRGAAVIVYHPECSACFDLSSPRRMGGQADRRAHSRSAVDPFETVDASGLT
ncbi:hypothetical protein VTN49DRAFT_7815 [Thermomyces lanuginosus]|uniref:uncharacterized protein n=1 Tax=Thermomyces lanuginosus TaxID=5541 RepID=UPI0037444749